MTRAVFALWLAATWLRPLPLAAQERPPESDNPRWTGHFTTASANVLLSALTAGITQHIKGHSFRDGFARGALGGFVIYG
jgi:hypothetical protein